MFLSCRYRFVNYECLLYLIRIECESSRGKTRRSCVLIGSRHSYFRISCACRLEFPLAITIMSLAFFSLSLSLSLFLNQSIDTNLKTVLLYTLVLLLLSSSSSN